MRKKYPTDLSKREWARIEKYFRVSYKKGGRPPKYSKKEILKQFSMYYVQGANGVICRMTFHSGRPYMSNSDNGKSRESLRK